MRVVSGNSDKDLAIGQVRRALSYPLRNLAANLMRIARGAGKPYEVGKQAVEVIDAFQEYRQVTGCDPSSDEIAEAVRFEHLSDNFGFDPITDSMDTIASGALQVAASRLLGQATQEAAGRDEIMRGLARREAHFGAQRAEVLASRLAARPTKRRTKKPPKG